MADVKTLIPAGGTITLRRVGEFVFTKYTDRPLILDIKDAEGNSDGPVEVKNGSMRRPPGGISEIEVTNPDQVNPCAAVFYIGKGDFDDKIIQGDVTVTPVIRYADGTTAPDTRRSLDFLFHITSQENQTFEKGELKRAVTFDTDAPEAPDYAGRYFCQYPDGFLTLGPANAEDTVYKWDKNGGYVGKVVLDNLDEPQFPGMEVPEDKMNGITYNHRHRAAVVICYDGAVFELVGADGLPRGLMNVNAVTDHPYPDAFPSNVEGNFWHGIAYNEARGEYAVSVDGVRDKTDPQWSNKSTVYTIDVNSKKLNRIYEFPWRISTTSDMEFWPEENGYAVVRSGTNEIYILDQDSGEITQFGVGSTRSVSRSEAGREFSVLKSNPADTVEIYSEVERSVWAAGYVVGRDCGGESLMKPEPVLTDAEVILTPQPKGRALLVGEIVKAIIELRSGDPAPDDYLDHVFGIEIQGQPVEFSAGGLSFAAAKVADDFTVETPARVRLTVDQEL